MKGALIATLRKAFQRTERSDSCVQPPMLAAPSPPSSPAARDWVGASAFASRLMFRSIAAAPRNAQQLRDATTTEMRSEGLQPERILL